MLETEMHMDRAEFRRWTEGRDKRYERLARQVVPMSPELIVHTELKMAVWLALREAIRAAAVPCRAFGDGITVEIGEDTDYEPDALVNFGLRPEPTAVAATCPVVVVEVLSRSTQSIDTGEKLAGYFRVPSIMHYLVVSARWRQVVHHRRDGESIVARIVTSGEIELAPPGIAITIDAIYQDIEL